MADTVWRHAGSRAEQHVSRQCVSEERVRDSVGLVVFVDNQSKMYALDQNTGKVLFSRDVPNGAVGVPAVYEVNGREYLLFGLTASPAFSAVARMPPGGVISPVGLRRIRAPAASVGLSIEGADSRMSTRSGRTSGRLRASLLKQP